MALSIMRFLMTLLGLIVGGLLGHYYSDTIKAYLDIDMSDFVVVSTFLGAVIFGLIGVIISTPLFKMGFSFTKRVEKTLSKIPFSELFGGTLGLILALLIAFLISLPTSNIPILGSYIAIILYAIFGYLGISLGRKSKDKWEKIFDSVAAKTPGKLRDDKKKEKELLHFKSQLTPKVLDTSVIIDGRIVDICASGFLEGPLVVTNFVLDELRHIADSGENLKRIRGRRGLDVLNALQELETEVIISSCDFPEIEEVDVKLVALAKEIGGAVVTNDYNLNKVATFQNIRVLNVNELAGAIKTVVLPGEGIRVEIVAKGKEEAQGVGYLDDGTMIVIENGKDLLGQEVDTIVTSVIQTNAGRMIFARLN